MKMNKGQKRVAETIEDELKGSAGRSRAKEQPKRVKT